MRARKYPTMGDDREWKLDGWPHAILVTWREGDEPQRFCGANWCSGECGLPALMLPPEHAGERAWKASGSQVACGPAFQGLRVKKWKGPVVMVPEDHQKTMAGLMWW